MKIKMNAASKDQRKALHALLFVTRDRRDTGERILLDLAHGNINSLYSSYDAAKSAAWQTEKVWKISLSVTEEHK